MEEDDHDAHPLKSNRPVAKVRHVHACDEAQSPAHVHVVVNKIKMFMISKYDLYQSLQDSFSKCHPKFPWPKRHDLVDQTPEFQEAFEMFTAQVQGFERENIVDRVKSESAFWSDNVKDMKKQLRRARIWNIVFAFILGAMVFPFALGIIVGLQ